MERRIDERDMAARPETQKETGSAARRETSAERLAETKADTSTTPTEAAGGSQAWAGPTLTPRRDGSETAGAGTRARTGNATGNERPTAPGRPPRGEEYGERPSGVPSAPRGEGTHGTRTPAATPGEPGGAGSATRPGSTAGPGNTTSTGTGMGTAQYRRMSEPGAGESGVGPVLSRSESDGLEQRLHHAVSGFVDGPRAAVEEADALFEETSARITEALAERRRLLRSAWLDKDKASTNGEGLATEELRTALRDYRDVMQRLLEI